MIDLDFSVAGMDMARHAVAPLLLLKLRVANRTPTVPVEHVMLQTQIRIEAAYRGYSERERERLAELFGSAADWDRGLRGMLWTNASISIAGFGDQCEVELPVACSYDFNVAATKYFRGIESGKIPLLLLFSGSVFFRNEDGDLQIAQIPHHKEAQYRLPVEIWQGMMEHYYPDTVWLRISRELFDELCRYKRRNGDTTVEQSLRRLLAPELAGARQ